jgi:tetrahydromethanopterin S-methyltransferase subunit E
MWLGELIVLVLFFGLGVGLTPTAHSEAFAKKRGTEDATRLRRETIDRSRAEYRARNAQSHQLFKISIGTLVLGFGLVMLFDFPGSDGSLSPQADLLVSVGWIVQVASLVVLLVVLLKERRYVVDALRRAGIERGSK